MRAKISITVVGSWDSLNSPTIQGETEKNPTTMGENSQLSIQEIMSSLQNDMVK